MALLWLGTSMLLASVVRALTGWAFSIIAVPMLSLVFPPDQAVVLNILLALAATGQHAIADGDHLLQVLCETAADELQFGVVVDLAHHQS